MGVLVKLRNVRLAFADLWEPKAIKGGKPRYGANYIVPKDHPQVGDIRKAMEQAATEKWGPKGATILANLREKDDVAFHEKPRTDAEGNVYDGFEGMFCVTAYSKNKQEIVDRNKAQLTEADGKPYAGCYVNAAVEFWAQDDDNGKRINCALGPVQFFKDGPAFAGGKKISANEAFDDLGDLGDEEEAGNEFL